MVYPLKIHCHKCLYPQVHTLKTRITYFPYSLLYAYIVHFRGPERFESLTDRLDFDFVGPAKGVEFRDVNKFAHGAIRLAGIEL